MKRMLILLMAGFAMGAINAQNITDGLRYATDATTGTARFNAMSGAFGALGGDMSAIAVNPAGSAIFLSNSATATFGSLNGTTDASYFGTGTSSDESDFNINQAGVVFVFDNPVAESSPWKKVSIGLNYNTTQNFDENLRARGTGNTSIGQFFLQQAQGVPQNLLSLQSGESISDLYAFLGETEGVGAQNAFLGFQGFIFDPVEDLPGNTAYVSNIAPGSFNQDYSFFTTGFTGKYTVNVAAQFTDNIFFGINLNSHTIDYDQRSFLAESNSNEGSIVTDVGFQNDLSVLGSGFSAQVGAIAKLGNGFRIGLTYDTPTWFDISEETTQYLETVRMVDGQTVGRVVDPNVINVFADYRLQTPGRLGASAAYVFGGSGLISVDYSYKDYSNIEFRPAGDIAFSALNNAISSALTAASTIRVGGEYRIENLSLRGGYMFEESPYADGVTVGDRTGYSAGAGYSFGSLTVDISYSRIEQSRNQQLYTIGLTDAATIDTSLDNILFTLGFNM